MLHTDRKSVNDSKTSNRQDVDPNNITRHPAPSGELYTDVYKKESDDTELKAMTTEHQQDVDPDNITRHPAPSGELYTDVYKKNSDESPMTTKV